MFARADQLKRFLLYVCEMEIAGRGGDLTEYRIGVEALGRPKEFSPNDDTSVRNRAYSLRQKLEKFYEEECPSSAVRIEFLKGTYIPRFVANTPESERSPKEAVHSQSPASPELPPPGSPVSATGAAAVARPARLRLGLAITGALLAGALIGALLMSQTAQWTRPASTSAAVLDPVVREAWAPLLDPRGNVLVCVAAAAQLTVLPFDFKVEWSPPLPTFEAPAPLYPWYLRTHHLQPGGKLFLTPDLNSPHFGDVLGAMAIARVLTSSGVPFQLLPERLVPSAALNERNVILFGVPHKSEAVRKLLESGQFAFKYDPGLRDIFLSGNSTGNSAGRHFVATRDERSNRIESYGLITVRPSPGVEGGQGRIVIFSADPSAGAAAAAEYFSSPTHMRDLKQRFAKEGYAHFPPSYQVVVRCRLDSNLPTSVRYEAHAVLH